MKKAWAVVIMIIAALLLIIYLGPLLIGNRIGSLEIEEPRPESFLIEQTSIHVPSYEQSKNNFYVFILPGDLLNNKSNTDLTLISLQLSELPFHGEDELLLNVQDNNLRRLAIPAKILTSEIKRSSTEIWDSRPIDVYKLKIELPENLNSTTWEAIKNGAFSLSKKINNTKKLIPETFILTDLKDSSKNYVCVVDTKREAFSIDYQYYRIRGHLQPITIKNRTTYEDIVGRGTYVDIEGVSFEDELAVPLSVSGCVKNPDQYKRQKFLGEYDELKSKVNGLTKVIQVTEEGYLITEKGNYKFALPLSYDNARIFKDFAINYLLGQEVRIELKGPDEYKFHSDPDVLVINLYLGNDLVNDKYKSDWRTAVFNPKTPLEDLKYYKNVAQILTMYDQLSKGKNRIVISTPSIFIDNDPNKGAVAPRTTEGNSFPVLINGKHTSVLINNNGDNKDQILAQRYAEFLKKNWEKWENELVIDFSNKEEFVRSYVCFNGYDCSSQNAQIFRANVYLGGVLLNDEFK